MIAMLRPDSGCWKPSSLRLRIGEATESRNDDSISSCTAAPAESSAWSVDGLLDEDDDS